MMAFTRMPILPYWHISELQETQAVQSDHRMARSFAQGVTRDAVLLNKIAEEEIIAARDGSLASRLAGTGTPSFNVQPHTTDHTLHDGLVARLTALCMSADIVKIGDLDEASKDNTADAESSS